MPSREDEIRAVVFAGPGTMPGRCREFDWASTPLGPVSGWSQSLRAIVSMILASRHPMFLWWGPDLIQIFNDGYLPSFGLTGRDVAALGAHGRNHWREIWPVIGPQIEQVMRGGEATWHEDHLVPIERNGRLEDVWWTYGYSAVRDDDGRIGGVLVVVQETTARVQAVADRDRLLAAERAARAESEKLRAEAEMAQERFSEMFRQAPAFIAVLRGPDFTFELANDDYYRLVGRRDIIGKPVWEALPDIRGQGFEELLRGVIETGEPFIGREVPVTLERTAGGGRERRFVTFVYAPLVEADGSRSGVLAHGVDVTDQVESRRSVEAINEKLQEQTLEAETARHAAEVANRFKSDFLASMSHELRTPLNAIAGYAQLIELGVHGPITDAQRVALERIQRSEQHLLSLVNDVLNFARVEAGRVEYNIAPVDLAEVVNDAAPMVEPQFNARNIDYAAKLAPDVRVRADRDKLQQILLNLLSNAIKFTEPGGRVWVDIGVREDGPDDVVHLRVSDTGIGIPRDKQTQIFDPFVQVGRDLTRSVGGTGLGLSISRDLARGMGGDLRVRSTPGEGSTFTLTLPRA
jgi:signal transduction histidine kinase